MMSKPPSIRTLAEEELRATITRLEGELAEAIRERNSRIDPKVWQADLSAAQAEAEANRVDAERYQRLCTLIAYGSFGVSYEPEFETSTMVRVLDGVPGYADNRSHLNEVLDSEMVIEEVRAINTAIDTARTSTTGGGDG